MQEQLHEFRQNAGFVGFILVVCFAAFVYLTEHIRYVLVPLVWSAFFAMPLTALIRRVDAAIIQATGFVLRQIRRERYDKARAADSMRFWAVAGESSISVERSPEVAATVRRVGNPCARCSDLLPQRLARRCCGPRAAALFRRRVRITQLTAEGFLEQEPKVNRLVQQWSYYLQAPADTDRWLDAEADSAPPSPRGAFRAQSVPRVRLELFLDKAGRYPAVVDTVDGVPAGDARRLQGTLEVERTTSLSWGFSVLVTMCALMLGIGLFVGCIVLGAEAFVQNERAYKKGLSEFLDSIEHAFRHLIPRSAWDSVTKRLQSLLSSALGDVASEVMRDFGHLCVQAGLFTIYLLFWLCHPPPINSSVAQVFKYYLLLKTLVCLLYAGLMSLTLLFLQCKIWHIFFVVNFFLNYIPEVGALVAGLLMLPAILFDGNLGIESRRMNAVLLVVFGVLFKVLTGNVIELRMYATRGGEFMRMHPLVLMALMMLCQALLGITGMFLAIPLVAAVKYYMVTTDMPGAFLRPLLAFVEGDEAGPHRNFVDRQRACARSTEEEFRGASASSAVSTSMLDPLPLLALPRV